MKLSINEVREIMDSVNDIIHENRDYLIELDAAMGDGDLGLTMCKGFDASKESIHQFAGQDIGKALFQAGMAMTNASPSTMGTLMATAIMRSGKAIFGKEEIELKDISDMGFAAIQGIKDRGKAKQGDKTILDALIPAVEALKEASYLEKTFKVAFEDAYKASNEGLEATIEMVSHHGKAYCYGDKSRGKQDPGATVAMLITKAIRNYFSTK
ncbi:MAG: dihydroxyacetone kinase subunit L [Halanaerobiales bacterium]|nr:dihydroxyacetone kinase subunit L [Halanaerobiales bacterium]